MVITKVTRHLGADLREHPDDPNALESAIQAVQADLNTATHLHTKRPDDPTTTGILARELNKLGDLLGLNGQLQEAEQLLQRAIALWLILDRPKALLMSRLKLAIVLRYQERNTEAVALIDTLLVATKMPKFAVYRPFLLIERGLNVSLESDMRRAHLQEALVFFQEKKSQKHLQTIRYALEMI